LAFNSTNWELRFTTSGQNGTRGYVRITIAKSLVVNITNVRVYLDGNQSEYSITSKDDSWLLTFTYTHSTHRIVVNLDITKVPEYPSAIMMLFLVTALLLIAVISKKRQYYSIPKA
jgi:hypothetical protein